MGRTSSVHRRDKKLVCLTKYHVMKTYLLLKHHAMKTHGGR